MYDIIGDIHGHAAELKSLLTRMDYKETNGVWQHPSRKAIFVGDLIDRGPAIREVLHIWVTENIYAHTTKHMTVSTAQPSNSFPTTKTNGKIG